MKMRSLKNIFVLFLITIFVAPTALLIAPNKTYAFVVVDPSNLIQNTISAIAEPISAVATVATQVNDYVLQPLAFVMSGKLLKAITAATIGFVVGKANGTGLPQFVADIEVSLQTLSDNKANGFFNQYQNQNYSSPFNSAILSELTKEYLNKTSLAGFWAQNMDTLKKTSPDINSYLNGRWSKGGINSWFALTTQSNNNPYLQYQIAQNKLGNIIGPPTGGAIGSRVRDIAQGAGFVSWCGTLDNLGGGIATNTERATINKTVTARKDIETNSNVLYRETFDAEILRQKIAGEIPDNNKAAEIANKARDDFAIKGNKEYEAGQAAEQAARAKDPNNPNLIAGSGVSVGDPCTNKDGTPGTVRTPGSVIAAGLNKVMGGEQDNVNRMGNVGGQVSKIFQDIGNIMNTVKFATALLGGNESDGGLLGQRNDAGSRGGRMSFSQYQKSDGNLGVNSTDVFKNANNLFPDSIFSIRKRVKDYETAKGVILYAATHEKGKNIKDEIDIKDTTGGLVESFENLINFCITQQNNILPLVTGAPDYDNKNNFMDASNNQINTVLGVLQKHITPFLFELKDTNVRKLDILDSTKSGKVATATLADIKQALLGAKKEDEKIVAKANAAIAKVESISEVINVFAEIKDTDGITIIQTVPESIAVAISRIKSLQSKVVATDTVRLEVYRNAIDGETDEIKEKEKGLRDRASTITKDITTALREEKEKEIMGNFKIENEQEYFSGLQSLSVMKPTQADLLNILKDAFPPEPVYADDDTGTILNTGKVRAQPAGSLTVSTSGYFAALLKDPKEPNDPAFHSRSALLIKNVSELYEGNKDYLKNFSLSLFVKRYPAIDTASRFFDNGSNVDSHEAHIAAEVLGIYGFGEGSHHGDWEIHRGQFHAAAKRIYTEKATALFTCVYVPK